MQTIYPSSPTSQYYSTNHSQNSNSTDDQLNEDYFIFRKTSINICKYKTEICKNYSEMGYCPYWQKCQFAHGTNDLCWKEPQPKKFYRTRKCKPFWDKSTCNYGFRCQFSHYECSTSNKDSKNFLNLAKQFYLPENSNHGSRLLNNLRTE